MEKIKTLIVYYSSTGANYQLAQWANEGALAVGSEPRIRKVQELAPKEAIAANPAWKKHSEAAQDVKIAALSDLEWADVIVFSAPTRYGTLPAQMKQFIDSTGPLWSAGKLANKIVTAMSSAMNVHGGQEATILSLYTTMFHWGALVVAPGYTDPVLFKTGGNPYGASATVDEKGNLKDDIKEAVLHQVKRAITVALWLKKGSSNNESVDEKKMTNELSPMKDKNKTERQAPIQDGDTRPDQNLEGTKKHRSPLATEEDKKSVTRERGADSNTLEDYKDAKNP